jgi:hypothetical protein
VRAGGRGRNSGERQALDQRRDQERVKTADAN